MSSALAACRSSRTALGRPLHRGEYLFPADGPAGAVQPHSHAARRCVAGVVSTGGLLDLEHAGVVGLLRYWCGAGFRGMTWWRSSVDQRLPRRWVAGPFLRSLLAVCLAWLAWTWIEGQFHGAYLPWKGHTASEVPAVARVGACQREGPVSLVGGLGYHWTCTVRVHTRDGRDIQAVVYGSTVTPADRGRPVAIVEACLNRGPDGVSGCSYGRPLPMIVLRAFSVVIWLSEVGLLVSGMVCAVGLVRTLRDGVLGPPAPSVPAEAARPVMATAGQYLSLAEALYAWTESGSLALVRDRYPSEVLNGLAATLTGTVTGRDEMGADTASVRTGPANACVLVTVSAVGGWTVLLGDR
jgi:hypothetical protein